VPCPLLRTRCWPQSMRPHEWGRGTQDCAIPLIFPSLSKLRPRRPVCARTWLIPLREERVLEDPRRPGGLPHNCGSIPNIGKTKWHCRKIACATDQPAGFSSDGCIYALSWCKLFPGHLETSTCKPEPHSSFSRERAAQPRKLPRTSIRARPPFPSSRWPTRCAAINAVVANADEGCQGYYAPKL
jgi:hypothetical protein